MHACQPSRAGPSASDVKQEGLLYGFPFISSGDVWRWRQATAAYIFAAHPQTLTCLQGDANILLAQVKAQQMRQSSDLCTALYYSYRGKYLPVIYTFSVSR